MRRTDTSLGSVPTDITAIGVLPSDRESLDSELERLVERHDLSIRAD